MRIIYNIAFIILGIFYLPYLVVTRRYRYGMKDKFGFLPEKVKSICSKNKVIWVHAVSVGEVRAAGILAPLVRKAFPSHRLVFSTVTHMGNKVAGTIAAGNEGVFFLPFDISLITDRVADIIRPEIFISMETELWPNLIGSLYKSGARIILANGRISDRSYSRYKKAGFFIAGLLKKFSLILTQSDRDAERILALGAPKEKVFVTGNLKFDIPLLDIDSKRQGIRKRLGLDENEILLIAGSTHRGEEEAIIDCLTRLKKEYDNIRLLIAPRHVERAREIENILAKNNLDPVRVSTLEIASAPTSSEPRNDRQGAPRNERQDEPRNDRQGAPRNDRQDEPRNDRQGAPRNDRQDEPRNDRVFILDTIGELRSMYSAGDIVFVGGSLVKKGGQNPIEPASLGKPIIFGRHTFNFHDVVRIFLENGAGMEVRNKEELYLAMRRLVDNPGERERLGRKAKDTISKNSGSAQKTIDLILK